MEEQPECEERQLDDGEQAGSQLEPLLLERAGWGEAEQLLLPRNFPQHLG